MSHAATTGGLAPDFEFARPHGGTGTLSELWTKGPLLTLWLRQCG